MIAFLFASAHMEDMKQKRSIEALVLAAAFVLALAQPHMNGLTVLACAMAAAVFAVEYRYTCRVHAEQPARS
jgi:hypothetical protein